MLKNFLNKAFIRFLLVGGLNTIFAYSLYALLIFVGLYYPFVVIITTIAGILFNYRTTGKLVFNVSKNSFLFKFIGVYTVVCAINIIFLRIFEFYKYNMYFAGAVLILPMSILSFNLNKNFVFKVEKK